MIGRFLALAWRRKALLLPAVLFSIAGACDLLVQHTSVPPLYSVLALTARGTRFGLLVGALTFLMGRHARWVFVPAWIWSVTILVVEAVANFNFGVTVNGTWLAVLAGSSWNEIVTVWSRLSLVIFLPLLAAFGGMLYLGARILIRLPYPRFSLRVILVGALFMMPYFLRDSPPTRLFSDFRVFAAWRIPKETITDYHRLLDLGETIRSPKLPPGLHMTKSAVAFPPLGLVVIGESSTRDHWQLYGYERPTTPCLMELEEELVVFRDPIATDACTSPALRLLFTDATKEEREHTRCLFCQKCAAVGCECALFGAQNRWGLWEGVEKLVFSGCAKYWHLQDHPLPDNARQYDDALIAPVCAHLAECDTNRVPALVLMHTMGSHFEPQDRYPPDKKFFPRYSGDFAPELDAESNPWNVFACDVYDNSIRFTDGILARLIAFMKLLRRPAYFVYFSDHGETPRARSWRMLEDSAVERVPLVVWFSPEYRRCFPETVEKLARRAGKSIRLDHLQDEVLLPLAQIDQTK